MYATTADLVQRFGQIEIEALASTDTAGVIDTAKVETALTDASAEMNSYLANRYTVPVQEQSKMLTAVCCDLTRYQLYSVQPTEEVTQRYQQRISWLRDIAANRASLNQISEPTSTSVSLAVSVSHTDADRLFTLDTLKGF